MPESPGPNDGPATYIPPAYDPRLAAHLVPRPENAIHPMGVVLSARRARPVGRSIAVTVLIAALAVAGWVLFAPGSDGSSHSTGVPITSGTRLPDPTNTSSGPESRLGLLLESIAIQNRDFPANYVVQLAPGGDRVRGQVTLDNCGFRFTTEAHRVARREYTTLDDAGRETGVVNELVAYDSAAQARKAVAQWHQAAALCPRGAVTSRDTGATKLFERISRNELHLAALPNAANALTVESIGRAGQRTIYAIAVLQVRGRILDAVY